VATTAYASRDLHLFAAFSDCVALYVYYSARLLCRATAGTGPSREVPPVPGAIPVAPTSGGIERWDTGWASPAADAAAAAAAATTTTTATTQSATTTAAAPTAAGDVSPDVLTPRRLWWRVATLLPLKLIQDMRQHAVRHHGPSSDLRLLRLLQACPAHGQLGEIVPSRSSDAGAEAEATPTGSDDTSCVWCTMVWNSKMLSQLTLCLLIDQRLLGATVGRSKTAGSGEMTGDTGERPEGNDGDDGETSFESLLMDGADGVKRTASGGIKGAEHGVVIEEGTERWWALRSWLLALRNHALQWCQRQATSVHSHFLRTLAKYPNVEETQESVAAAVAALGVAPSLFSTVSNAPPGPPSAGWGPTSENPNVAAITTTDGTVPVSSGQAASLNTDSKSSGVGIATGEGVESVNRGNDGGGDPKPTETKETSKEGKSNEAKKTTSNSGGLFSGLKAGFLSGPAKPAPQKSANVTSAASTAATTAATGKASVKTPSDEIGTPASNTLVATVTTFSDNPSPKVCSACMADAYFASIVLEHPKLLERPYSWRPSRTGELGMICFAWFMNSLS
jgi:hypothetical protein